MRKPSSVLLAVVASWAFADPLAALVDPSLQPADLVGRRRTIIAGTVTGWDEDTQTVFLEVTKVCKGEFAPSEITVRASGEGQPDSTGETLRLYDRVREGDAFVAMINKLAGGEEVSERDVLLYTGFYWHRAMVVDLADPSVWVWTRCEGDDMKGTFFGSAARLVEMTEDIIAGRFFFPAVPFTKFREEAVEIGRVEGGRGVAFHDLDSDRDLDVVAASEKGVKAFLQTGELEFADRTFALGLDGVAASSVSVADVDADGDVDLLLGGRLLLQDGGRFAPSGRLPGSAAKGVLSSAFVDADSDGWPDVVVSGLAGGLRLYKNPGARGGEFADSTAAAGLDRPEAGSEAAGHFMPGYWNEDDRIDLFYASRRGVLLAGGDAGTFEPVQEAFAARSMIPGRDEPGLTGAGAFSPQWRTDTQDITAAADSYLVIVTNVDGRPENVSDFGNESALSTINQLAVLCEDLNADGYVDLFTLSRSGPNYFHTNRGYGSYMVDQLYPPPFTQFPDSVYDDNGAWGAASGDVNGDGAVDVVLTCTDGMVRLIVNDTLSLRDPALAEGHREKKLANAAIVSVTVDGPLGVIGSVVTLFDAGGRTVARRMIGGKVLTGCRSADEVHLVVREPAPHVIDVRWSDGVTRKYKVDASPRAHVELTARREERPAPPAEGDALLKRGVIVAAAALLVLAGLVVVITRRRLRNGKPNREKPRPS